MNLANFVNFEAGLSRDSPMPARTPTQRGVKAPTSRSMLE